MHKITLLTTTAIAGAIGLLGFSHIDATKTVSLPSPTASSQPQSMENLDPLTFDEGSALELANKYLLAHNFDQLRELRAKWRNRETEHGRWMFIDA